MSLINREEAIELMCRALHYNYEEGYAVTKMLELPSTEEKTGEWVYNSPVTMKCNQCGFVIKDWDWDRFKYCPGCGVKMKPKK